MYLILFLFQSFAHMLPLLSPVFSFLFNHAFTSYFLSFSLPRHLFSFSFFINTIPIFLLSLHGQFSPAFLFECQPSPPRSLFLSLYLHTVYPSLSVSLDNQFYFYWKVTGKCLNFYTIVLSQSLSTRICAQLFLSFSRKSYMYHILISEVI